MPTFWIPPKALSPVDAFNRACLAIGAERDARSGKHAAYNGHRYEVGPTISGYSAGYQWAGWNRLRSGSLTSCLETAIKEYRMGGRGASVSVRLRDGDEEGMALCNSHPDLHRWSQDAIGAIVARIS